MRSVAFGNEEEWRGLKSLQPRPPGARSVGEYATVARSLSLLLLRGADFAMICFPRHLPGEMYWDTVVSKVACGIRGWPGGFPARGAEGGAAVG